MDRVYAVPENERKLLSDYVQLALDVVHEELGPLPAHRFIWDNRSTSTAGSVTWKSIPEVRLATKVFAAEARINGIDAACEQIYRTTIHEFCHLYAGEGHEHDNAWAELMEACGIPPSRYHHMATRQRMIPADLREEFYLGAWVKVTFKGGSVGWGIVQKHNPVRVRIILDGGGYRYDIPWAVVRDCVEVVR